MTSYVYYYVNHIYDLTESTIIIVYGPSPTSHSVCPHVISVATAAAGYANTGLLAVIFLYLVAEGIYQTGRVNKLYYFKNLCTGA